MAQSDVSSTAAIQCVVVTPEATALETPADFVALPLYDGEYGIDRGHSPLIGRLGYGELRIQLAGNELAYYVDGGFVQVADDVVSVLTNRAMPSEEIDAGAAAEQLRAALSRPAAGDEELAIRDRLIEQARGQLHVTRRVAERADPYATARAD